MITKLKKIIELYKNTNLIAKASIWFLAVTIIDKGIAVITQPIINRILSVDEVGIYGVYSSWYSIFSVLATFNLYGGVLEVYITKEKENTKNIVASLCSLTLFISILFWLIVCMFNNDISSFLGLKKIYLFLMALSITSEAIIQFWCVPRRFEYSYKVYAIMIVSLFAIKSALSVLATYYFKLDRVMGRILGLTVPSLLVAIILVSRMYYFCDIKKIFEYWKKGILFNLPLIPHYLSSILLSSSDRVMIQKISGENDAGLYTVSYSYASLALIVFGALNNAYNPLSMKAIKDKNYKKLASSTHIIVLMSVLFSLLMMLLAPEGMLLLGGKSYVSVSRIIPITIAGIFFSSFYFVFSNIEFVYEKTKWIFPITMVGALLNIGLNLWLIPIYGFYVAAYTTFIGYWVIAIAHYCVSRRIIKEDVFNSRILFLYVLILIAFCCASCFLYNMPNIVRYGVVLILMLLVLIIIYKNKERITKILRKE